MLSRGGTTPWEDVEEEEDEEEVLVVAELPIVGEVMME